MAFPQSPLDVDVELQVGGAWTDITPDVYLRDKISISRGRQDEASQVDPSTCTLTLNNRAGKYSPRNPMSPYYGLIGRNTPLRVSVHTGSRRLVIPAAGARATTPDAAALDITGDIDIRVDAQLDNWGNDLVELAAKQDAATNQRSWRLLQRGTGVAEFVWTTDGTGATGTLVQTTMPLPTQPASRLALRITLDVDNGAGGWTVTWYTAPTLAGPWTQFGSTVTGSGTTSIFNSSAPLDVGDVAGMALVAPVGVFYGLEVRNGIDGTVVANPDFTAPASGTTSFADSAGRTWTLTGGAEITDRRTRFTGEVSSWPSRWDVSGKDVWVPIEAAGVLRRLGQGATPLQSVMRREMTAPGNPTPIAYWPCEDSPGATVLASALGGAPMAITGTPAIGASDEFACSDKLPVLAGDSSLSGTVATYTATNQTQCRWLMKFPAAGLTDGRRLLSLRASSIASRWDLTYWTGGALSLRAYDDIGVLLGDSGPISFNVDGRLLRLSIELTQSGPDINYTIETLEAGAATGAAYSDTVTGRTVGRATRVIVAPDQGLADVPVGHIAVYSTITSIYDLTNELKAWQDEPSGRRIERLCAENQVPFRGLANLDDCHPMGTQQITTLLTLIDEAADVDVGGVLYETRDQTGLGFRPHTVLYNQSAALALTYTAPGEVAPPLEPVEDDQHLLNDVTVERTGGSSARATADTGPLSTQAPPAGVGRYSQSVTLNLANDSQPGDHAAWMVRLGTWDEARYPRVNVDLAAGPHLIERATGVESGDRITIASPPPWLAPGTISLLVHGYSETIGLYDWDLEFNCSPAGPWTVAVTDDPVLGRAGTDGSQLAASATSTAGQISVSVTAGPLWTTDPADCPLDILVGGEVMTVTKIMGAVHDDFNRTVTSGWGSTDTGQSWTTSGGSASDYSVQGV